MAPQEIILQRVSWSETTAGHLAMIDYMPPTMSAVGIEAGLALNDIFALGVFHQGRHVGTVFYQFNDGHTGSELYVIGAGGHLPGVDLALSVMPALEGIAKQTKCLSVAFDTARLGLVRKMAKEAAFRPSTITMRKDINQ